MKNPLLTLSSLIFPIYLISQKIEQVDDNSIFQVKCVVKNNYQNIKNASLRITENGVFYKVVSPKKGKFELTLPKNSQFMLEFSYDGHFTKKITINTELAQDVEKIPLLLLTIKLVGKEDHNLMDKDLDLLDLPLAYMAFNPETLNYYDKNRSYTKTIMKGLSESAKKYFGNNVLNYK